LQWIDDSSNYDERYDRNFLRSAVIPLVEQRFPGVSDNVARSAVLCRESEELLNELAALDLAKNIGTYRNRLPISSLLDMSEARQRNLLRHWLAGLQTEMDCAAPGHVDLQRIVREVIPAAPDGEPSVFWGRDLQRAGIRRFQNVLYLLKPMPAPPEEIIWNTAAPLDLPFPLGRLHLILKSELTEVPEPLQNLRVSFRKGGEQVTQANRPTRTLKKILQEFHVPPWLRESVPLLYTGAELLAVGDLIICRTSLQKITDTEFRIGWVRPALQCGY
jgi:tRNA(Ile)-lysidine synthase